jgi:hypothetical protein
MKVRNKMLATSFLPAVHALARLQRGQEYELVYVKVVTQLA